SPQPRPPAPLPPQVESIQSIPTAWGRALRYRPHAARIAEPRHHPRQTGHAPTSHACSADPGRLGCPLREPPGHPAEESARPGQIGPHHPDEYPSLSLERVLAPLLLEHHLGRVPVGHPGVLDLAVELDPDLQVPPAHVDAELADV